MSKPASLAPWSTDLNFSSGPETGTVTKVEPSAGAKAQGWVPGQPLRGPRLNWWQNLIGQWVDYLNLSGSDELTYANTRTRTVMVSPQSGFATTTAAGANSPSPDNRGWTGSDDDSVTSDAPGAALTNRLRVPLALPHGCTLTQVRAGVFSFGTPSLAMSVTRRTHNKVTPASGSTATLGSDTATTNDDVLVVTFSEAIDSAAESVAVNFVSDQGGDIVYWIELTYTETRATGHY